MHHSFVYWLTAAYRGQEDLIVADDAPSAVLMRNIRNLGKRWIKNFDKIAERLAKYFATSVAKRSTANFQKILRDGGFTVKFEMTPGMKDIQAATVHASVSLIKSIPAQYLDQVEGIVMRGVQNGRDAATIAQDLEKRLGVTKRRAALIARDQNNKATAAFTRVRMIEAGITQAVWQHSHGGKEPRPTHLAAGKSKTIYNVAEGWYDPDKRVKRYIQPGELINCRCVSKALVPGFT